MKAPTIHVRRSKSHCINLMFWTIFVNYHFVFHVDRKTNRPSAPEPDMPMRHDNSKGWTQNQMCREGDTDTPVLSCIFF